jgi:tetratricopeptide (TPR) repeat protein
MGALQTLQGMWNVLDGGNVSGAAPENSREDDVRQSNESLSSKSTTLREKDELNQDELDKGVKGGARAPPNGGMSMRMVDHRADRNSAGSGLATMRMHARSREARKRRELEVRKLEEALDADEAADAAGGRGEDGEGSAVDPEDLMRLANRLIAMRQFEAALPYSMRAARRYERRNGRHDHETMMAVMLSAKLLRRLGHVEKAVEQFTLLLGIQEVLLGTDHPEVGNTASALGSLYATNGSVVCDLDRAARCFEQVLRIREKIMYESGVDAIAEAQAAATGEEAGEDGSSGGGGGGGGGGGRRGSSQRSGSVHSDNKRSGGVLSSKAGVALALHHLGVVHGDLYHFDDSLAYFMRALKIRRSLGDSAERDTASTLNNMAAVLHQLGRNEQCLAVYGKSLEIKLKLLPPTHPSIADTLYNMGALNLELNRPADASEYFVQALTISTNKLGMNHPLTADLQKQILTCDALADQQQLQEGDGDGEGQDGEYSEYSGGGFAGGGAAGGGGGGGDTALTSRLKQDNGLFSSEYNLNRQGSMASVSTYMSESPESETPPSGGVTPTFGGYGQGGSYGGPPRRSLTGQALNVLATPPSMSPLGLQPTKERG